MDGTALKEFLNGIYYPLVMRAIGINNFLGVRFCSEICFESGNIYKNENGQYCNEEYPIPVLKVKGLCKALVETDRIIVTTKLTKQNALLYNFSGLDKKGYRYELYSDDDYFSKLYDENIAKGKIIENIEKCSCKTIGIDFLFSIDENFEQIAKLIKRLASEKFYL